MMQLDQRTGLAVERLISRLADQYNIAKVIHWSGKLKPQLEPIDTQSESEPLDEVFFVVLPRGHQSTLEVALAMSDAAYDVLLETGIYLSPLPIWLDHWEQPGTFSRPALLQDIARDGVCCFCKKD